jgi:hypothetical protein
MKCDCLGFIDEAAFAQIPWAGAQSMIEKCSADGDVLRQCGQYLGGVPPP